MVFLQISTKVFTEYILRVREGRGSKKEGMGASKAHDSIGSLIYFEIICITRHYLYAMMTGKGAQ